jgi:hypothetical protein
VQTIIGIEPHIRVIGIPQLIIFVIMSQHILSMSMLIMPVGSIMHCMPFGDISQVIIGFMAMPQQLIIGMPEHIIMQGVPFFIIMVMVVHMSFIMSMLMPSAGIIMHCMPFSVMVQVIRQDMGIIIATGIEDAIFMFGIIGICMGALVFMGVIPKWQRLITGGTEIIPLCNRVASY